MAVHDKLPAPGDPRALYVVDISGYVFRAYHALPPLQSPQGEPTHAVLGVTTMLQRLIEDQRPALLAIAMDSKGRSFRHQMFPEYKATRQAAPPDLGQQVARLREIIDAFAIPVLHEEGVEADDLIASLAHRARAEGHPVVIVSADKDMLQLVGDDIVMYDTGRNIVYGPEETVAKLGVPPALVRDYLALVGDTSDNIPGVPSVGPKTAVSLLTQFGSLDGVYASLDQLGKKAVREKLETHRDKAYLSRDLATLKGDLDLGVSIAGLARQPPDNERLQALFRELGFVRLIQDLPDAAHTPPPAAPTEPVTPPPPAELIVTETQLAGLKNQLENAEQVLLSAVTDDTHAVRAGLVGLVLACDDLPPAYVPVGHTYLGHPEQLPLDQVLASLAPALRAEKPRKVCVDLKRDLIVFAQHGIDLGGIEFDARLASYLADAERHGHSLRELAAEFGLSDQSSA
ncbi:MAG TPA: 5'-3' exonuclease H3TH domain-containing protein, partial [Polyangiales bacterium]|nr:5'-3' exonuclease H3TH domain-containing protein [Polyangiales bacterium]